MTRTIAGLVHAHAVAPHRVLFLGDDQGVLEFLRAPDGGEIASAVVYPCESTFPPPAHGPMEIANADPHTRHLPDGDKACDVVICNQWLMRLTHVSHAIAEAWRVLVPGGLFVVSVANLSALHNCVLLALGRQPSTIALGGGHVRGFAYRSMSRFLRDGGRFDVLAVEGIGLHPFTSRVLGRSLRPYAHTTVWALQKPAPR